MDPQPNPPDQRKRKMPSAAAQHSKCTIGRPHPIVPAQQLQCCLCHQSPVAIERNFGLSRRDKTVLLICDECSGVLDNLDSFRKQAFCSIRFLLTNDEGNARPRLCRFCFVTGEGLVELFDENGTALVRKLLDQMREWLEIVIDSRDAVTTLCRACIRSVAAIAALRIEPSTDIFYLKTTKPKKKVQQERRDAREEADQNLLTRLQNPFDGRDFSVLTADVDPTMQIEYQGHLFRLAKHTPAGGSTWKCVYCRLHHCSTIIKINPEGTSVISAKPQHNHPAGPDRHLAYPQGKSQTTIDGSEQPFYLTYGASGKSPYTRTLFLAGHRYYLMTIRHDGSGSKWCCNRSWDTACKVYLTVEGLFEEIKVTNEHVHGPYGQASIERYLKDCGVDLEGKVEQETTISKQISNFTLKPSTSADRKSQITFNGHDFHWVDQANGWCCMWYEIRRCPVRIQLSSDGRSASFVDSNREHNHSDEVIAIFWHKLGKNVIFDEQESHEFWYQLSECKSDTLPNRRIEYQGYRYGLVSITDNRDSVWKCDRCDGSVRILGLFWIVDYRCLHDHGPLTLEELDYDLDLLPYNYLGLPSSIPESPSSLLKLLSIDEPERNFQVHCQGDLMKILQEGYEYFYCCSKPTYSLWKCFYSSIRGCGATLHVDNHGRIGTPSPFCQHNHSIELWDLYYHRLGESSILNEDTNSRDAFIFLIKPDFMRPLPHFIYDGHLFTLVFITELGERSKWRCVEEDCVVTANVTGLFERISVSGLPHCEDPLDDEVKREWIRDYGTPDEF